MNGNKARPYVIPVLVIVCGLFYYFGELVDWAAWNSLRASFFYGVHDIHRLLFLAPIVYAGYTARVKGALILTLVALIVFLPRAFFISPYPDPLLRMLIFTLFAGAIGVLVGLVREQSVRALRLEEAIRAERDKLLNIVDGIADGIMITDHDYKIHFMNSKMVKAFGDGTGRTCYRHINDRDAPCRQDCHMLQVSEKMHVEKWRCRSATGQQWDVVAAPFVEGGQAAYQIAVFREITGQNRP